MIECPAFSTVNSVFFPIPLETRFRQGGRNKDILRGIEDQRRAGDV
jgi:hypothetical protein